MVCAWRTFNRRTAIIWNRPAPCWSGFEETRRQWLEQRVIPLGLAALDDYVQHA